MAKSFNDIKLPDTQVNRPRCAWCDKPLPRRHVTHKNISQNVTEHQFCSRDCMEKWCYSERK